MPDQRATKPHPPGSASADALPAERFLSLVAWTAAVLLVPLLLAVLGGLVSRETSMLTAPGHAFAAVAVVAAAWLLIAYPLWPGTLLGRVDPLSRFWAWLGLRLAEAAVLLAVAAVFLMAAAVFSGVPLTRAVELVAGLSGTAAGAVAYRLVHQSCSDRLRALAVLDVLGFLFGPLVVGYLLLEFAGVSMGWCWLISPLALAREVSRSGLPLWSASFLVGVVALPVLAALTVLVVLPVARRHRAREARLGATEPF